MTKIAVAVLPSFAVRGITFDNRQQVIVRMKENQLLELVPEPENRYDPNAITILFAGEKIGYVPRQYSAYLKFLLQQGAELYISCVRIVEKLTPEGKIRIPIVLIYQLIEEPEICQRDLEGGGR